MLTLFKRNNQYKLCNPFTRVLPHIIIRNMGHVNEVIKALEKNKALIDNLKASVNTLPKVNPIQEKSPNSNITKEAESPSKALPAQKHVPSMISFQSSKADSINMKPGSYTPWSWFKPSTNTAPSSTSNSLPPTSSIPSPPPPPPPPTPPDTLLPKENIKSIAFTEEIKAINQSINNQSNNNVSNVNLKPSDVLNIARERKLIYYDDTKEFKDSAELKFTKQGYQGYRVLYPHSEEKNTIPFDFDNCTYEVGLLQIHPQTEILLPSQTHLIIAFNHNNNTRIGIGFLTSQNSSETIKLSESQVLSGNNDKAQYFRLLLRPLELKSQDFIIHDNGTKYIQDATIQSELKKSCEKVMQYKPVQYNPIGITMEDIKGITKWHDSLVKPEPKKVIDTEKMKNKEIKAELNKQKQILKEKDKVSKLVKDENKNK